MLSKVYDQQPGKLCQGEGIERLIGTDARKITQTQSPQLKLFSLFSGRQNQISHG